MDFFETDDMQRPEWGHLHFNTKQIATLTNTGWNWIVLIAVAFLHVGVLGYLFQGRQIADSKLDTLHDALQIEFIERAITPELKAEASGTAKNIEAKKDRTVPAPDTVAKTQATDDSNDFPFISLRLTLDKDEWNAEPVIAERNLLKRQHIALAGRAEPFVKGIKLRNKLTPEQKLSMVGKLLFASVDYDSC